MSDLPTMKKAARHALECSLIVRQWIPEGSHQVCAKTYQQIQTKGMAVLQLAEFVKLAKTTSVAANDEWQCLVEEMSVLGKSLKDDPFPMRVTLDRIDQAGQAILRTQTLRDSGIATELQEPPIHQWFRMAKADCEDHYGRPWDTVKRRKKFRFKEIVGTRDVLVHPDDWKIKQEGK